MGRPKGSHGMYIRHRASQIDPLPPFVWPEGITPGAAVEVRRIFRRGAQVGLSGVGHDDNAEGPGIWVGTVVSDPGGEEAGGRRCRPGG